LISNYPKQIEIFWWSVQHHTSKNSGIPSAVKNGRWRIAKYSLAELWFGTLRFTLKKKLYDVKAS